MKKEETITFKVDQQLAEALRRVPNRSEFIRNALRTALDAGCPLCQGTGTLTVEQQRHWREFVLDHQLARCDTCHAVHLVCRKGLDSGRH